MSESAQPVPGVIDYGTMPLWLELGKDNKPPAECGSIAVAIDGAHAGILDDPYTATLEDLRTRFAAYLPPPSPHNVKLDFRRAVGRGSVGGGTLHVAPVDPPAASLSSGVVQPATSGLERLLLHAHDDHRRLIDELFRAAKSAAEDSRKAAEMAVAAAREAAAIQVAAMTENTKLLMAFVERDSQRDRESQERLDKMLHETHRRELAAVERAHELAITKVSVGPTNGATDPLGAMAGPLLKRFLEAKMEDLGAALEGKADEGQLAGLAKQAIELFRGAMAPPAPAPAPAAPIRRVYKATPEKDAE